MTPYVQYSPNQCACGCGGHPRNYHAKYIAGHKPKGDPVPRFWAKVEKTATCWLWTGAIGSHGYGTFWDGTGFVLAHRYSLALAGQELDPALHIDHLCRHRPCVHPDHLEQVTQAENTRRGVPHRVRRTHCPHGHDYSETGFLNGAGHRECRTCVRSRRRVNGAVAR